MNPQNYISDEEFLPFLQSLEVESERKSFEWMFNDPELSSILLWLYNSLDSSNALSAREKYRYAEIEKRLLSPEDLSSNIQSLLEEFPGLCLPGDQDKIHDAKMDVAMQNARLNLLKKQEAVIKGLINQNDLVKEELSSDITKLNSAQHQLVQDHAELAKDCISLANDVESLTEGVEDVIADTLMVYGSAHTDKETAKKFVSFGPFESYGQSQALFRSHFDLFVSRRLDPRPQPADGDPRSALLQADVAGNRLSDAALAYIDAKTELAGEQAKLALVVGYQDANPSCVALSDAALAYIDAKTELAGEQAKLALVVGYQDANPSCVAHSAMAEQVALGLEQEEAILEQQIRTAVKELADSRTELAAETTARAALSVRERIHANLTHLLDTTNLALSLDRALYYWARAALRAIQEFLQLTAQLKEYYTAEGAAVADRIRSMNEICTEQDTCERKLQSSDHLLDTLCSILGVKSTNDVHLLVKLYNDLQSEIAELRDNVYEEYDNRERALVEFQKSTLPLRKHIWDGCTKLPNCWDTRVAAMTHTLRQEIDTVDRKVTEASGVFSTVKNGDKQGLRKLWQWFLADKKKLAAAMRVAQGRR